jgi:magnesium chelatase family protein
MLVKIYGSAIHGVSAQTITIEVNVDTGIGDKSNGEEK